MAADLLKRSWQRRSAGAGAHGQRYYDWAYVDLHPRVATKPGSAPRRSGRDGQPTHSRAWQAMVERDAEQSGRRWWLLVRRHPSTGEQANYICFAPAVVPLSALVKVACRRWTIEESFR